MVSTETIPPLFGRTVYSWISFCEVPNFCADFANGILPSLLLGKSKETPPRESRAKAFKLIYKTREAKDEVCIQFFLHEKYELYLDVLIGATSSLALEETVAFAIVHPAAPSQKLGLASGRPSQDSAMSLNP